MVKRLLHGISTINMLTSQGDFFTDAHTLLSNATIMTYSTSKFIHMVYVNHKLHTNHLKTLTLLIKA